MLSPLGYSLAVGAIVIQRLVELSLSSSHAKKLTQKGAYEIGEKNYLTMKILHTLFFCALVGEGFWHFAPPEKNLIILGLVMIFLGQALRLYSMAILGERWTTKVFVVPGHPPIQRGLYSFFNHPNYLGVVLELWALPMLGGLWWTAGFFLLANFYVLRQRVSLEHKALALSEKP
ncbi:MAG: hypothetical protein A2X86_02195 [Bdellovibrionales bacterium GWA2_49_15]|nr:MAG: hypothetical protein A2X86_02195 [Bdellovibrionales bacterium GWA2_49_15]